MSIRTRVAVAAMVAAALVVALSAAVIVRVVDQAQRDALDRRLSSGAVLLAQAMTSVEDRDDLRPLLADLDLGVVAQVVAPDGSTRIRLGRGPTDLGEPIRGLRTVDTTAGRWRVFTRPLGGAVVDRPVTRLWVQVASPLEPIEVETARVRRRVWSVGLAAAVAVGLVAMSLAALGLRPLTRLRRAAEEVAASGDLNVRVSVDGQPKEVAAVSASMNTMLDRIQQSAVERERALESSRAFAADASHELRTPLSSIAANLELLEDNPDLDPDTRRQMVGELRREQARLGATLAALEVLARGDLVTAPTEAVDLGDLVSVAASAAQQRHESLEVHVVVPDGQVVAIGWAEGLRSAVDNLLDNAALHGRVDDRTVRTTVMVSARGDRWVVSVDDDGRGIPERDRDRVLQRFERGQTSAPGTGLGLPIVAQQAHLHGSQLTVEASPAGGVRFSFSVAANS